MEPGPILAHGPLPYELRRKHRVVIAVGIVSIFLGLGAFGTVKDPGDPPSRELVIEPLAIDLAAASSATTAAGPYWYETRFERGDTFDAMLRRLSLDGRDIAKLLKDDQATRRLRQLQPGTAVHAQIRGDGALAALRFMSPKNDAVLGLERTENGFRQIEDIAWLRRQVFLKSGEIHSSLFAAADAADVPDNVITQFAEIFSGEVDFHRDLQAGDRFAVAYEVLYHNGQPLGAGRVLAAELVNNTKTYRAVWFADESGTAGYYTPDGKNVRKIFMRSPLEFTRITSGFSRRLHPIFADWRAHKGVDYAAPTGTRVLAMADGIVQLAGQQNGYGNVIVLAHHSGITTLYAHLSRFATGIRTGARVRQGDLIAFVGATGWATGPHLHYEFRVNGEHRNPLTTRIQVTETEPVPPHSMNAFRAEAQPLLRQLSLAADMVLAGLE